MRDNSLDPTLELDDPVQQLEREVERRRERLSMTLRSLRTEIDDARDWRHWYDRHPFAFLAGAALLGFTAARLLPPYR